MWRKSLSAIWRKGKSFRSDLSYYETGLDPKFETLRNRDNCSERRFGWQQPVF